MNWHKWGDAFLFNTGFWLGAWCFHAGAYAGWITLVCFVATSGFTAAEVFTRDPK